MPYHITLHHTTPCTAHDASHQIYSIPSYVTFNYFHHTLVHVDLGPEQERKILGGQDPRSSIPHHTKPLCAADIEESARLSEEKEAQSSGCALIVSYVLQVRTDIIIIIPL